MELSVTSTNAIFGDAVGGSSAGTELSRPGKHQAAREAGHAPRLHGDHGLHGRHGRALGIFRQELKLALSASFGATFAAARTSYSEMNDGATPREVAADTLGTAQRIVSENPEAGSRALITIRHKVETAATFTRETVGSGDDVADVEDAVGLVNEGLDALEAEAAQNVESSASVLAVDSRTRQRSTIRIRTQEGDIVKLDLRRANNFSATDVAVSNKDGAASETVVEFSSRSRLVLRVDGDLNDAEFAAIKNVFAQAESIADEFFNGDLSAAFGLAAGFEFDAEQLARVNLRLRNRQDSNVGYAAIGNAPIEPAGSIGSAIPAAGTEVTPASSDTASPADFGQEAAATGSAVNAGQAVAETQAADDTPEATGLGEAAPDNMPFSGFFDLLSDFLKAVAEGFESQSAVNGGSFKYHHSQSFKLEILKSVIQVTAPDESADAANVATSLIDGVASADNADETRQVV